jgi:nucleotide-binding universal stress UspA family protein
MTDRILVALDGSPFAEQVLPYATRLARRCGTDLLLAQAVSTIVTVGTPAYYLGAPGWPEWDDTADEAAAYLTGLQADVEAQGVRAEVAVIGGGAPAVLLDLARDPEVRLIVMATHGRSGPSRWVLGSVAEQVLRETQCPVLLLTPKALAAGTAKRLDQRVIVAMDGSARSARVVPPVLALTRCLNTPITLVRAIEPAVVYGMEVRALFGSIHPRYLAQRARNDALDQLQCLAEDWRAKGCAVETVVAVQRALDLITGYAADHCGGWIAMASHGRGGLGGLVLGSTALAVLRQTTLPVLLVAAAGAAPAEAAAETAQRDLASLATAYVSGG